MGCQLLKFLQGHKTCAGGLVVIINRQAIDGHAGRADVRDDLILLQRHHAHAPVFTPCPQRRTYTLIGDVEETNQTLGDAQTLLQDLIRLEGEIHGGGIRTDQHMLVIKQQIHRMRPFRVGLFL